jgi:hypothetical protein
MVHKRGLGSLPKGLEWIEPRLELEEETTPEPAQEPLPVLKLVETSDAIPVQAVARTHEKLQESQNEVVDTKPETVMSKPVTQKKVTAKIEDTESSASLKGLKEGWTRATFIVKEEQLEKLKAVAYWERITVKEVIEEAFTLYLQNKNVRKIPVRSRSQ